jgi:hypothetical protein
MNTIWILILVVVGADGNIKAQLNFPQKSEYNTQTNCNENGQIIANQLQTKIGTENGRVFFYCDGVPRSEITKSLFGA